ncbi:MAG: GNAT family N-acetyltransferase [Paenibacillus sp.]|nr:GNAT family N-acetyltransferase [Paenibacillus sp.]
MNVRLASVNDIEGIARVHVDSWKSTYHGILPDTVLANISIETRINNWKLILNNLHQDEVIYIIEDDSGNIVGFVHGGKCREMEYDFELYALYLLKTAQGNGYGKLLFNKIVQTLQQRNYQSLMLWVLEENPSIYFYKRLGGQYITKKEIKIGEVKFTEIALGWNRG